MLLVFVLILLPTDQYEIIKDRREGDRGVLIANKTTFNCTEQTKLRTECEISSNWK
jgi:hypothetical protein